MKIKECKLVGFDFDGTLVDNYIIPKEDLKKLFTQIKKLGKYIAIITGKGKYFIDDFLKKYNLEIDFLVSYDGGSVYDYNNKKDIFLKEISKEKIEEFMNISYENLVENLFLNTKKGYIFTKGKLSKKSSLFKYLVDLDYKKENVFQIYIRDLTFEQKIFYEKKEKLLEKYFFETSGNNNLFSAIFTEKIDKKTSLDFLLYYLKIKKENFIYFGDSVNDIPFFEDKNITKIAVFESIPILKEKATYSLKKGEKISDLFF